MKQFNHSKYYSLKQLFLFMEQAVASSKDLIYTRNKGIVTKQFTERIMLAVTEVNGCALCAYEHTKIALKAGVDQTTIKSLLSGSLEQAPQNELKALLFAQYYANCNGQPQEETIEELKNSYGKEKAKGIIAVIRMIMVGNVIGIAFGALLLRFKGKSIKDSSLIYELGIIFSIFPFFLVTLVTNTLRWGIKKSKK